MKPSDNYYQDRNFKNLDKINELLEELVYFIEILKIAVLIVIIRRFHEISIAQRGEKVKFYEEFHRNFMEERDSRPARGTAKSSLQHTSNSSQNHCFTNSIGLKRGINRMLPIKSGRFLRRADLMILFSIKVYFTFVRGFSPDFLRHSARCLSTIFYPWYYVTRSILCLT